MTTRYSSNNSGGSWWLKDEDWFNLEQAGWVVNWVKDDAHYNRHRSTDRWLGALATSATRDLPERIAIAEFEEITGQSADEEGCGCCGEPHHFSDEDF